MMIGRRLSTIASMAIKCNVVADIGTDHAYIPISLVENGTATKAIASDIAQGPLDKARSNIGAKALSGSIETRLGSGLDTLEPGEADVIVISGMGGILMRDILIRGEAVSRSATQLVLSPHSDIPEVRRFLVESGYFIVDENIVKEEGKYYFILDVRNVKPADTDDKISTLGMCDNDYLFGNCLKRKKGSIFGEYLMREIDKSNLIIKTLNVNSPMSPRIQELNDYIKQCKEALEIWRKENLRS